MSAFLLYISLLNNEKGIHRIWDRVQLLKSTGVDTKIDLFYFTKYIMSQMLTYFRMTPRIFLHFALARFDLEHNPDLKPPNWHVSQNFVQFFREISRNYSANCRRNNITISRNRKVIFVAKFRIAKFHIHHPVFHNKIQWDDIFRAT
jgi:hypothetical protein